MNNRLTRDDIRREVAKLGCPLASENLIDRIEERLNCHYGMIDPTTINVILNTILEDELRALRGDVHRVAEEAAKTGATEGAKIGAAEGVKAETAALGEEIVKVSGSLDEWLKKAHVGLTTNTSLWEGIQKQIQKGKGVTLKVDRVALSPQTRRELVAAIPEAVVRAVMAEQQRPIRRANAVIFVLALTVIFLLTVLAVDMRASASRPTEKSIHWAVNDVTSNADKAFRLSLLDRQLDPNSKSIPRDIALSGAKRMADRVEELSLGRNVNELTSEPHSWKQRLWDWAEKHQAGSVIFAALALFVGFLGGKGWR